MIYEVKICTVEEKSKLQYFLSEHWQKNHVLSYSDKLLDFQHLSNSYYNFVIGLNLQTGEIDGLFGFIPTWQFDESLKDEGFYCGAIWKVRQDVENDEIAFLGNMLWKKVLKLPDFHCYLAVGISQQAVRFYELSKLKFGKLNQYFIPNVAISDYKLAKIDMCSVVCKHDVEDAQIKSLVFDEIPQLRHSGYPRKSVKYIENRYHLHPFYTYLFYGLYSDGELKTVWICRVVESEGSCCLRIMDMFGDLSASPFIFNAIQPILMQHNAEYVDCMCCGIDKQIFLDMGFTMLDSQRGDIIPNYFEPFVKENVSIECAYTNIDRTVVVFKGDSDQDRPNKL